MASATQTVQELISYTIVTDKSSLVSLLKRNGIVLPSNASDKEVTHAVLIANGKSVTFRDDLTKLLGKKLPVAGEHFASFAADNRDWGFTGLDDFKSTAGLDWGEFTGGRNKKSKNFTGGDGFFNASAASSMPITTTPSGTTAKGKTGAGKALSSVWDFLKTNVLTQENINAGIGIGLQSLANKQQKDSNSTTQTAQQLQVQQQEMQKQLALNPPPKKSNTSTYVLIGVGALAFIGVVYLIVKKKK
jgi:hypothetical protein